MLCRLCDLDVVCDELNDCAWNLGLYQLSDKCVYFNCDESFAHIEYYSDCSRRGAIWLNPFATVLFTVCSAVTVECCVFTRVIECACYVCCYVRKNALLQCLCNY